MITDRFGRELFFEHSSNNIQVEILNDHVKLIPAKDSDVPNMKKWEMDSIKDGYPNRTIPPEEYDRVEKFIEQDAKDSVWKTRMITFDDEIIGMLTAYQVDDDWYIGEIYIDNRFRGHGIGTLVMKNEISKHDRISLNVYKQNHGAIKLYKSLGFKVYDETEERYMMRLIKSETVQEGFFSNRKLDKELKDALYTTYNMWTTETYGSHNMKDFYEGIHMTLYSIESRLIPSLNKAINKRSYGYKTNKDTYDKFNESLKKQYEDLNKIFSSITKQFNSSDIRLIEKSIKLIGNLRELILDFVHEMKDLGVIQEGAWNDIKNGVNPYSAKTFFHVSKDSTLNGKTLKPRIPDYISKTKFGEDNPYYEDGTIPRVCFSNSVEGALNAIVNINDSMLEVPQGVRYYVYIPEKPISEYKHKTNKELKKEKLVFDASTTGECWITEPVKLKLYGVVMVQQVSDIKEKKTVSGYPHGRVDYKWKWAVKPKVVDKSRGRYDGDEDNNKTVKEGYAMSGRNLESYQLMMEAVSPEQAEKNRKENLRLLKYNPIKRTIVVDGPDGKPMTVKASITNFDVNATELSAIGMKKSIYVSSDKHGEPYIRIPPAYLEKDPSMLMPVIEHEIEHINQLNSQKQRTGDQVGHVAPRDSEAVVEYTRNFIKRHARMMNAHDRLEYELLADFHAALKHGRKSYMKALRDIGEFGWSLKRLKTEIVNVFEDQDPQLKLFRKGDNTTQSHIKVLETHVKKCEYIKKNCEKVIKLSEKQAEKYEAVGIFGWKYETDIHQTYVQLLKNIDASIQNCRNAITFLKDLDYPTIDEETKKTLKSMNLGVKIQTSRPVLFTTMINSIISTELRGKFIKQIMRDKPWLSDTNGQTVNEAYIFDEFNDFDIDSEFIEEYGIDAFNELTMFMESTEDADPEELTIDDADNNDSGDVDVNINIDNFGSDNGSTQNEYDPKEAEKLSMLIASEAAAMGEYLDAAKTTNVDVLRRLYSDIGNEERFHIEQLLFAKASLTGETYEPRDPEVKKEYEELLAMGMDEETALNTAIDKQGMMGADDGDDSDMQELEEDVEMLESAIMQYSTNMDMLEMICESNTFSREEYDRAVDMFMETYCFVEGVDNVADNSQTLAPPKNPIVVLMNGFAVLLKFINNLSKNIRQFVRRIQIKNARKNQWIKEHGIRGLFERGVSIYFYNEKQPNTVSVEPLRYVELLHNITRECGKYVGYENILSFDNIISDAAFNMPINKTWQPIQFNTIQQGCNIINGVVLTKTKVIVTDANESTLANLFFGYTDKKTLSGKSANIYNALESICAVAEGFAKIDNDLLNKLRNMESDPNSIYYTNRKLYTQIVDKMKVVNKGFKVFIRALAHDMKVVISLNNGTLEQTQQADKANKQNPNATPDQSKKPL